MLALKHLDCIDEQEYDSRRGRNSLGSTDLAKALPKEGFEITRYRAIKSMERLKLVVTQRIASSDNQAKTQ
jgi:hypothetical protein